MKSSRRRFAALVTFALVLVLALAVVAHAAVPQSTIDAIIKDAADGRIDGDWTAAEIRAALAYLQKDPSSQQYFDKQGVLKDYLASLQAPSAQQGELAFTGAPLTALLAGGVALVSVGALLRRRG